MILLARVVRVVLSAFVRLRVEGDLAAIPRTGSVILAANHVALVRTLEFAEVGCAKVGPSNGREAGCLP